MVYVYLALILIDCCLLRALMPKPYLATLSLFKAHSISVNGIVRLPAAAPSCWPYADIYQTSQLTFVVASAAALAAFQRGLK